MASKGLAYWRRKQRRAGLCIDCTSPAVVTLRGTLGVYCQRHRLWHSRDMKRKRWAANGKPKRLISLRVHQGRITKADLAYAAALIDGEGSIGFSHQGSGTTFSPNIAVGMTDPEPIRFMSEIFGGNIIKTRPYGKELKFAWLWRASGRRAGAVCYVLAKSLKIGRKRNLARLAVKVAKAMGYNTWRINSDPRLKLVRQRLRDEVKQFYQDSPYSRGPVSKNLTRTQVGVRVM